MTVPELIELIRDAGEDWLLQLDASEERSADHVRKRLDAAFSAYKEKFPVLAPGEPQFDDDALLYEASANPHRVRALLQAIGASSPMMVALVWRIIQGDTIKEMDMRYRYEKEFELTVLIHNEIADIAKPFTFNHIEDASLLRHLGIMCMGDAPIFDGYYALNLAKASIA